MNERIKELVDQCWEEDGIGPADFNPEKFAELIVRECVWKIYNHPTLFGDSNYKFDVLLSEVKEHFGVA